MTKEFTIESYVEWTSYIASRYKFYANAPKQKRVDDYPWDALGKNNQDILSRIFNFPLFFPFYKTLIMRHRALRRFNETSSLLFEARSRLCDEMSRLIFDEAVMMRMLGHHRYVMPRLIFDKYIQVLSAKQHDTVGIPAQSNGIDLIEYSLKCNGVDHPLTIITTEQFILDQNRYRQYFLKRDGIDFTPKSGDVVFDCGACLGDTTILFGAHASPHGEVHSFDPIPLHNRVIGQQVKNNPAVTARIKPNCMAVGAVTDIIDGTPTEDVNVISPGGIAVTKFSITRLDDYAERENLKKIDYIKMDVEGYEIDALAGAKEIIKKHRPNLAISVYHKDSHFWEVIKFIDELDLGYKFYFDHHSPLIWESLVYCQAPK
jgi:FkbM family methyltransferase